jgi:hypothetical protein
MTLLVKLEAKTGYMPKQKEICVGKTIKQVEEQRKQRHMTGKSLIVYSSFGK